MGLEPLVVDSVALEGLILCLEVLYLADEFVGVVLGAEFGKFALDALTFALGGGRGGLGLEKFGVLKVLVLDANEKLGLKLGTNVIGIAVEFLESLVLFAEMVDLFNYFGNGVIGCGCGCYMLRCC